MQQNGAAIRESGAKVIISHHNLERTLSFEELQSTEAQMRQLGADVAKLAMTAEDITDSWTMLQLLQQRQGAPGIVSVCLLECDVELVSVCLLKCCTCH